MKLFKNKINLILLILMILTGFNLLLNSSVDTSKYMLVHYIDVGQGDAILIQVNNKNLLIDSGPLENREKLLSYLNKLKIKSFDYIIATHPHEDHIGNMSTIIRKYDVKKFYAPKVTNPSITFEKMVSSLVDKNLKINIINFNTNNINLGKNTYVSVLSPTENFYSDNLNEYSPIIKIQYLNTSFLFTGDAETSNENQLLSNNTNLHSDVLKIGHHGSDTSSSNNFLSTINPSFAIISVGKNNKYNHPNFSTLNSLKENNINYFRTDLDGTILCISDGNKIKFKLYK